MRIRTLLTKNPVCLEWFRDGNTYLLVLSFGSYEQQLYSVDDNYPDLEDLELVMKSAEKQAIYDYGLEVIGTGKDAIAAYYDAKEKGNE